MRILIAGLALLVLPIQSTLAQIKIGAVTCLTGALSTFGVSSVQGAKLAEEDINVAGGVLGQPIELVIEDNGSKAGKRRRSHENSSPKTKWSRFWAI